MPKINDPGYRPLHIRGFDNIFFKKNEHVVKLRDSERMSDPAAALREVLAAFIAAELDIAVVEPVIVNITPDTADLTSNPILKRRLHNSVGKNFGTVYLGTGYQVLPLLSSLSPKLEGAAQDMVVFDLLLQNPDRTSKKPNMLTNGSELIALDHELAFSFNSILFAPVNLWQQTGELRRWIDDLILLPHVKGKEYDFDELAKRLERLDQNFWERAAAIIPAQWMHESFEGIKTKMTGFIQHKKELIEELKRILS
jgi:hypothetical protein